MTIITHNLSAMTANRQLKMTTLRVQKTSEKLSSGYFINRAADDAAGLSISEKMRAQIRGLDRAADNLQDGISYVQVADGALAEVHNILQRINELAVQAANDTNTAEDREALDQEVQSLKQEMEHIFVSTSFNNLQIWDENSIANAPTQVGTEPVQALKMTTPASQSFNLTNENYNKIAKGSYKIHADTQGVHLSWNDYDGNAHNTNKITWDTLEAQNYSFQIADYFDTADPNSLFDANGDPLFNFKISFTVEDCATIDNMIVALDGTTMSSSQYTSGYVRFEDASGNAITPGHISSSTTVNFEKDVIYASHVNTTNGYDYDYASDTFAEAAIPSGGTGNMILVNRPDTGSLDAARTSTDTWRFSFNMPGIGNVTATSTNVCYYSNDKSSSTQDIWWHYYRDSKGNLQKSTIYHSSNAYGNGTLGSVMDCLTGPNDSNSSKDTPGLLTYVGTERPGGTIQLEFTLKSNDNYTGKTSDAVGTFTLSITVDGTESEQDVLDRINAALNENTILDIYTTDNPTNWSFTYPSYANTSYADKPVYENHFTFNSVNRNIQSGPNTDNHITITYLALRVEALNLHNTNILTEEAAGRAIQEVQDAINIVSRERSKFGAYQNRMEHAMASCKNTSENTGAAESRIRDADIASEVLQNAKDNILLQVAQSMLAQSNAATNGVLNLLK